MKTITSLFLIVILSVLLTVVTSYLYAIVRFWLDSTFALESQKKSGIIVVVLISILLFVGFLIIGEYLKDFSQMRKLLLLEFLSQYFALFLVVAFVVSLGGAILAVRWEFQIMNGIFGSDYLSNMDERYSSMVFHTVYFWGILYFIFPAVASYFTKSAS